MKGQMHFNWIFVTIVGAIALAFFVGFAFQYKDLQEKKTELIFLNNLDTSFINLQSSSFQTTTKIDLPIDFGVDCDKNGFSILINSNKDVDYIIASKKNLRDSLYIWYKPYENPFFVTNFYYFIDDEPIAIQTSSSKVVDLIEDLPDSFKEKVILNSGGRRIDIVNDNLIIDGVSYDYLDDELVYAAMFSSNYSCLLDRFRVELGNSISSYSAKANLLRKAGCSYNLILGEMSRLNSLDKSSIERLSRMNRELIGGGCPNLF